MTEQIVSDILLWYAGRYDPLQAVIALSWLIGTLLAIGTSPTWLD